MYIGSFENPLTPWTVGPCCRCDGITELCSMKDAWKMSFLEIIPLIKRVKTTARINDRDDTLAN